MVVDGVMREAGNRSVDKLAQGENEVIIGLLRLRAQTGNSESVREEGGASSGKTKQADA
jgi:hypothetical protein